MNKKGFTLVEIIAVIGLLSIIIVIAVPAITNLRQNTLEREDEAQKNSIESAAVYYIQDTTFKSSVTIQELLQNNYLDPTYKNGQNGCTETYGCVIKPSDGTKLNSKTISITKDAKGRTKAQCCQ